MQLRHMKTVQPAAEGEKVMQRVTALCWAPNNMRLAAVTTDRIVHLFDENGERRDKFSTKPADSKVRRRATIQCLQRWERGRNIVGITGPESAPVRPRSGRRRASLRLAALHSRPAALC